MRLELEIQNATTASDVPKSEQLRHWAEAALARHRESAQLSVRLVDEPEGADLNRRFRGRRGATNVLSFPFESLPGLEDCDLIGDLAICAPLVVREAVEQGTTPEAHWAHILVHGVLHLLGYDHQDSADAIVMERAEADILLGLGFDDPYKDERSVSAERERA